MQLLSSKTGRILNIAHRAVAKGAIQNTLAGVTSSIEIGVDGIEIDLQQTSDRKLVIFHDKRVRLNGKKTRICDLTWAQIHHLDLAGANIPLLEDIFRIVRNTNLFLLIDIKWIKVIDDIISLIYECDMVNHAVVASFDPRCLFRLRHRSPEIETALIIGFSKVAHGLVGFLLTLCTLAFPVQSARYLKAGVIMCSERRLSKNLVLKAHAFNIPIFVWSKDGCLKLNKLSAYHIDGILSFCADKYHNIVTKNENRI